MTANTIPRGEKAASESANLSPDDFLTAALKAGRETKFDFVGMFVPPQVVDYCDGRKALRRNGNWVNAARSWSKKERALKDRYPGILLSFTAREKIKYKEPLQNKPLLDWIRAFLNTAWAHWSRGIAQGETKLQFRDWFPNYLDDETWSVKLGGRWLEAAQVVRLSIGLKRFPLNWRRGKA